MSEVGSVFLANKATEQGVYKLPSGLLFRIIERGTGDTHPLISTSCDVHYRGTFMDGTPFDNSYDRKRPSNFAPNQVIKGWTEALMLMREGDKWEIFVPYTMAYGDKGKPPKIPAFSPLVFEMHLLKVHGKGTSTTSTDEAVFKKVFGRPYAEILTPTEIVLAEEEKRREEEEMRAYLAA
eukprot:GILI01033690.1.p1 GENE.GILI01033690.1~~GILI01033690.1.p1  ORF type:complete len:180 (-),score=24.72 GILI01033690.1:64-603(-)